eukprot:INCI629.1.p1 GENE.INCI629.1~~INCI629.1.p1  ORF type:complete len:1020 (+),score=192.12 INCI629.1:243-3302(+)
MSRRHHNGNRFVGVTCSSTTSSPPSGQAGGRSSKKGQNLILTTASHTVTVYRAAMTTQRLRQWATLPKKSRPFSTPCAVHSQTQKYLCAQGSTVLCWDDSVTDIGTGAAKLALDGECAFLFAGEVLRKNAILALEDGALHTVVVEKTANGFRDSRALLPAPANSVAGESAPCSLFAAGLCNISRETAVLPKSSLMYEVLEAGDGAFSMRLVALSLRKHDSLKASVLLDYPLVREAQATSSASGATSPCRLLDVCYHTELQTFSLLWDDATWQTLSIAPLLRLGLRNTRGPNPSDGTRAFVNSHSFRLPWMMTRDEIASVEANLVHLQDSGSDGQENSGDNSEDSDHDGDATTETKEGVDDGESQEEAPTRRRRKSRRRQAGTVALLKTSAKLNHKRRVRHLVAIGASRVLFICDDPVLELQKSSQTSALGRSQARASDLALVVSEADGRLPVTAGEDRRKANLRFYDARHGVPLMKAATSNIGSHVPNFLELVQSIDPGFVRPQNGFVLAPRGSANAGTGTSDKKKKKKNQEDDSRLLVFGGGGNGDGGSLSMLQVVDSVATMASLLGALQSGSASQAQAAESLSAATTDTLPTSSTLEIADETGATLLTLRGNTDAAAAVARLSTINDADTFCQFVGEHLDQLEFRSKKHASRDKDSNGKKRRQSATATHDDREVRAYNPASVLKYRSFILAAVNWCCGSHSNLLGGSDGTAATPAKKTRGRVNKKSNGSKNRHTVPEIWNILRRLLRSGCVSWALCPGLLRLCFRHSRLDVLEDCIRHVGDLPETEAVRVIRFVWGRCKSDDIIAYAKESSSITCTQLEAEDASSRKKRRHSKARGGEVGSVQKEAAAWLFAGVANFVLLAIAGNHSDHFLQDALVGLGLPEVLFTLRVLSATLELARRRHSSIEEDGRHSQGSGPILESHGFAFQFRQMPSEAQLIDSLGLLLDAHVSNILLAAQSSNEAAEEAWESLQRVRELVDGKLGLYREIARIKGCLEAVKVKKRLPQAAVSDYSIEVLRL